MQVEQQLKFDYPGFMLRNLKRDDASAWYDYLKEPQAIEHTSWNLTCLDDLLPQFDEFESNAPTSQIGLAIICNDSGQLAGTVGFHTISSINRSAELSYNLAPKFWGQGLARVAAVALCDWAYQVMQLNRIQATVLETNLASIKVLERSGFEREGYLKAYRMVRGKPGNFWMYSKINPALTFTGLSSK
jgi:ribosomal-protein-alanine N-acetyltransferase